MKKTVKCLLNLLSHCKNNNGFTLIEMLIVVMIIAICTATIFLSPRPMKEWVETDVMLKHIASDIQYAQVQAITKQAYVIVDFLENTGEYDVLIAGKRVLSRDFSPNLTFKHVTIKRIVFFSNGTSNTLGSLIIQSKRGTYSLKVYLGKGRFTIDKQ